MARRHILRDIHDKNLPTDKRLTEVGWDGHLIDPRRDPDDEDEEDEDEEALLEEQEKTEEPILMSGDTSVEEVDFDSLFDFMGLEPEPQKPKKRGRPKGSKDKKVRKKKKRKTKKKP